MGQAFPALCYSEVPRAQGQGVKLLWAAFQKPAVHLQPPQDRREAPTVCLPLKPASHLQSNTHTCTPTLYPGSHPELLLTSPSVSCPDTRAPPPAFHGI